MFFGPYGPPFSWEGRNIPIFFIALRSSGSFGHAGLLSEIPEFAGFLSRRGCPVAAAHGFRSRCVHLPRHSEPGFRRFVPAPGLLRLSAACEPLRLPSAPGFSFGGRSGLPVRIPALSGGPGCVPVLRIPPPHVRRCPGPGGVRGDGFRGGGVFAARFFGCRELPGLPCLTGCGGAGS